MFQKYPLFYGTRSLGHHVYKRPTLLAVETEIPSTFITHCSLQGLLCDLGQTFQLSPPGVSTRVTTREHPAAEGGTVGEKFPGILPKCRFTRYIQGPSTCRKATTWDRRLYFPSEGEKIRRLRPGANLRTWVPKASTLPLDHRSRYRHSLIIFLQYLFQHVSAMWSSSL